MLPDLRSKRSEKFKRKLTNPPKALRDQGFTKYSKDTAKSYGWHVEEWLQYMDMKRIEPEQVNRAHIKKYLNDIHLQVEAGNKSKSFYLQAGASLELWARTMLSAKTGNYLAAIIRNIKKSIAL